MTRAEQRAWPARFWAKVEKTATCWLWKASCGAGGYGNLRYQGKIVKAHRISYALTFGPAPQHLDVLHRCDNPRCVNPGHLFLGTAKDNMRDCVAKGRYTPHTPSGAGHPMAKLTAEQVLDMRKVRQTESLSYRAIAERFGVTTMTAYRACVGGSWRDIHANN